MARLMRAALPAKSPSRVTLGLGNGDFMGRTVDFVELFPQLSHVPDTLRIIDSLAASTRSAGTRLALGNPTLTMSSTACTRAAAAASVLVAAILAAVAGKTLTGAASVDHR